MSSQDDHQADSLRIDKWLWAARFFKTRALAADAVKAGKVEVNGARPKPAKCVAAGDELRIRRGPFEQVVIVSRVAARRGPASEAATLYEETPDSLARRTALAAQLSADAASRPQADGRPTKKQRRQIVRFIKRPEGP
jgi:ribosome-associated heat shock protein Hsp15